MSTKTNLSFRGKVVKEGKQQIQTSNSYLKLTSDVKMLRIKEHEKSIKLDFLPYIVTDPLHPSRNDNEGIAVPGGIWYRRPFLIHSLEIAGKRERLICPSSVKKPCPICEAQRRLFKKFGSTDEVKRLRPQSRDLYPVIPIESAQGSEAEVLIWDVSSFLFQEVLVQEIERNERFEDFFLLNNGLTLEITFTWNVIQENTFPKARRIDFYERPPYNETILERVPSLDDLLIILPYEEIERKFLGYDAETVAEPLKEKTLLVKEQESSEKEEEIEEPSYRERKKVFPSDNPLSTTTPRSIVEKEPLPKATAPASSASLRTEAPRERTRQPIKPPVKEAEPDERCPYGHKFGVNIAEFSECNTCELWDECDEAERKRK